MLDSRLRSLGRAEALGVAIASYWRCKSWLTLLVVTRPSDRFRSRVQPHQITAVNSPDEANISGLGSPVCLW